nr:HD domain-containing phosphohydrolase [uncultured Rhodoferax sp.]
MSSNNQPHRQTTGMPVNEAKSLRQQAEEAFLANPARLAEHFDKLTPKATQDALYELRVDQIELEMQNDELRRSQAELDTSQARYFDFYDMAPVGYCTVKESELIEQANLTTATLLGMNRALLVLQKITRFILPDDQDIFYLMRQRILETGEPQRCELRFVKQDGTTFWACLDALAVPDHAGTPSLRIVMTDITERVLATKELAYQAEEKGKRAAELLVANRELTYQAEEKGKRAAELLIANQEIKRYIAELETAFMSTVQVVNTLSEMRDPYTAGHERKVAEIAVAIGAELGLSARDQEGLRVAGYLHDIGKISIPSEILSKPGALRWTERQLIQEHAQASYEVLKDVKFPWKIAEVVRQHHERIDGSGYPQGLKGEAIQLEARILAVADVVEAMSSHRPYRPARGIEAALAEIERGCGSHFDVTVVNACLSLFREKGYVIPD